MTNSNEVNNEDWKKLLRSELINGIIGTCEKQDDVFSQVGYYYMCYAPAFLYKYYNDNPEKLETVKNNKMWYSAPNNFNDVFDCDVVIDEKEIINSVLQKFPDKRGMRVGSQMWRQLRETMNKKIRSLKFTFEDLKKQMGISCLSESDDSLLMWAHYANNHCGMCVEYELLEINEQLGFSPVPVIYSDERVKFHLNNIDTIESDSTSVFVESITSKSPEWSYEREWRIIRDVVACGTDWNPEKKGALLEMIRPSSVILGCKVKPEFENSVYDYCEKSRINLYKMKKNKDLYKLEKIPILQFDKI